MSRLIKFPTHVKPDRVGSTVMRVNEMLTSPLTNVQQVVSRGNAAWRWSFQYRDVSEDERDVVEAFIADCQGGVNTFKVRDPADYETLGAVSNWIDLFNDKGDFTDQAEFDGKFSVSGYFDTSVSRERTLSCEWRNLSSTRLVFPDDGPSYQINSFEVGKAYCMRAKFFPVDGGTRMSFIGNEANGNTYETLSAPLAPVESHESFSATFIANVATMDISVIAWTSGARAGDQFEYADWKVGRCALVSNSENLLTQSNNFGHGDWTKERTTVESGYGFGDPFSGVSSGSWALFGGSQTNSVHLVEQTYTKQNTEELYTFSVYAKAGNWDDIILTMTDEAGASANVAFYLSSGTANAYSVSGNYLRSTGEIFDIGSEWYRCAVTAVTGSHSNLTCRIYLSDGTDGTPASASQSSYVEIFGAQLRAHPFAGRYVPTTTETIVGTYQSGSDIEVDGLDPDVLVAEAGQRIEVVTRFHDRPSDEYERSEFKRITRSVRSRPDGTARIRFDPPIRNRPIPSRTYVTGSHPGETMHNPIIFHKPEMKARLIAGSVQVDEKPLKMADISFEVIEDLTS